MLFRVENLFKRLYFILIFFATNILNANCQLQAAKDKVSLMMIQGKTCKRCSYSQFLFWRILIENLLPVTSNSISFKSSDLYYIKEIIVRKISCTIAYFVNLCKSLVAASFVNVAV